jgi:hypothetical protein
MTAEKLVFRSVYVDPDVDEALRAHAERIGTSKGQMFRTYLRTGMARSRGGLYRAALPGNGSRLAARTVYLPVELDADLRAMAFDLHATENDLVRELLRIGMSALRAGGNKALGA